MKHLSATDKDIVVYGHNNTVFGTDKAKIKTNMAISESMNPQEKQTFTQEIVNPHEVLQEIKKKLTPLEIYVLTEHSYKI